MENTKVSQEHLLSVVAVPWISIDSLGHVPRTDLGNVFRAGAFPMKRIHALQQEAS